MALWDEASAAWQSHASAAVIEFPRRVLAEPQLARRLQGTSFSQSAGTDNWVHLPVPIGGKMNGRVETTIGFKFTARLNENARIAEVRLSNEDGTGVPRYREVVSYLGERVNYEKSIPGGLNLHQGPVISLHIEFLSGYPLDV